MGISQPSGVSYFKLTKLSAVPHDDRKTLSHLACYSEEPLFCLAAAASVVFRTKCLGWSYPSLEVGDFSLSI